MKVLKTTAIKKLARLKKRKRVVPGGTSAGKTFGIIPILIDRAIKTPGLEISIVSESVPHLRKGALKDFLNIMQSTGRFYPPRYNRTLLTYTFSNGSYIEFFSADQEAKVRGPRRNVLYINECNNISFQTYHQLAIRTSEEIWLDFNPSHKFWVHEELANEEDADWLTLTYKDNEALPNAIVAEIDRAAEKAKTSDYWANWYKVYGLGQLGSLEGVIFQNWKIIDKIPEHAKLTGYGLDFGYTNDPTAVIARYWADGAPILDEVLYKTGMQNEEIAKHLDTCGLGAVKGFADSAEPKSIDAISRKGASVRPVKKGRDSILFGIQALQQHEVIYVTKRSLNLIKELRNYTWDKDREGNTMNVPIDAYNHCFVGETLITTIDGLIRIDQIQVGQKVLTSKGYKPVLNKWNNGKKQVNKYLLRFDTFKVYLHCTEDHKIKTNQGWIAISKLKKGQKIYLHNSLTENNTIYIQGSAQVAAEPLRQISIVGSVNAPENAREVYDLEIEECHEYVANGVLVHNCIDAARYCEMMINLRPDRPRSASSGPKPRHKHNRM